MVRRALSKNELLLQVRRFFDDKNRGISIEHFSEMCGYSATHIRDVFIEKKESLSETMQLRVSRVLESWRNGEIRVMENPLTRKRYPEYRPGGQKMQRGSRKVFMNVVGGKIVLQPSIANKADYSRQTLDEMIGE